MRQFLLLTLLISGSALACPELAGAYKCQSDGNAKLKVEIRQSLAEGITIYRVNIASQKGNDVYRADGRPDVVSFIEPNTGVKIEITTTSTCEEESLKAKRTFAFDGEVLGKYDTHIRKENGKLQISNFFKGVKDELKEEIVCL